MVNKATCLYPQPNRTPEITYVGEEQEIWVTEVEGGMKVSIIASCSCGNTVFSRSKLSTALGYTTAVPLASSCKLM
jgi:hypothetical protein